MVMVKKSKKKKRTKKKRESSYQKWDRGGRIEPYTMGEALGSKKWP